MLTGDWRLKWHKYRYVLVGALIGALISYQLLLRYISLATSLFQERPIEHDVDISNSKTMIPPQSSGASIPTSRLSSSKVDKPWKLSDPIAAKPDAPLIREPPAVAAAFILYDYELNRNYDGWPH